MEIRATENVFSASFILPDLRKSANPNVSLENESED